MESLSKFNFLKVADIKDNNKNNDNEKNLISSTNKKEKSFIIDQVSSLEQKTDYVVNNEVLDEPFNSIGQKTTDKTKKKSNNENLEISLVENSIRIIENNESSNSDDVFLQKSKEKNNLLNIYTPNKKKINISDNIKNENYQKIFQNDVENNITNKPELSLESIKINKSQLNVTNSPNFEKKSKIKSFFRNYFNFTLKKYSKKNINLKKVDFEFHLKNNNKDQIEMHNMRPNNSIKFINDNIQSMKKSNKVNLESNNREQVNLGESNIKPSVEKNISSIKESVLDNFDRLKNILDIRSNDIKQRFSQILENNIRMNNNKFEIYLRPENLGKVHVILEITGQNVDININSDNISAIQSLTENNSNLQKMLQNHGMNLNNFNFNSNNKGSDKAFNKSENLKKESESVKVKENNNDDNFASNKLVYVKA